MCRGCGSGEHLFESSVYSDSHWGARGCIASRFRNHFVREGLPSQTNQRWPFLRCAPSCGHCLTTRAPGAFRAIDRMASSQGHCLSGPLPGRRRRPLAALVDSSDEEVVIASGSASSRPLRQTGSQDEGHCDRSLPTSNNEIFVDTESVAFIAGRQLERPMSRRNGHLQQAGPPILVALVAQPDGRWSNLRPDQVVASPELTQMLMAPLDGRGQDNSQAILAGFAILTSWRPVSRAATLSQGILLHFLASQHRRCGPCVFFSSTRCSVAAFCAFLLSGKTRAWTP